MNRREFLMSIGATLIPRVIRVNTLSPFGLLYHDNDGTIGTWNGITRTTIPDFKSFYGGAVGGGKSLYSSPDLIAIWNEVIPKIKQTFERDNKFYGKL